MRNNYCSRKKNYISTMYFTYNDNIQYREQSLSVTIKSVHDLKKID